MNDSTKKTIWQTILTVSVTILVTIITLSVNGGRDKEKRVEQKLEQKVDKEQYQIDQKKIDCKFEENKKQIEEQNKLFLDINKNLGELNGKMDLIIQNKKPK